MDYRKILLMACDQMTQSWIVNGNQTIKFDVLYKLNDEIVEAALIAKTENLPPVVLFMERCYIDMHWSMSEVENRLLERMCLSVLLNGIDKCYRTTVEMHRGRQFPLSSESDTLAKYPLTVEECFLPKDWKDQIDLPQEDILSKICLSHDREEVMGDGIVAQINKANEQKYGDKCDGCDRFARFCICIKNK